jgi:hypothetical protein
MQTSIAVTRSTAAVALAFGLFSARCAVGEGLSPEPSTEPSSPSDASGEQATPVEAAPDQLATSAPSPPPDASAEDSAANDAAGFADADASGADVAVADASPNDAPAVDDGSSEAGTDAGPCLGDLSGIGTGDFHVSLTITTIKAGPVALVNQRWSCGRGMFWDLRIAPTGVVELETDDGSTYVHLVGNRVVNDGSSHHIAASRVAKVVSIVVDGISCVGKGMVASSFDRLSPLQERADPCDGTSSSPFAGKMSDVCVTHP